MTTITAITKKGSYKTIISDDNHTIVSDIPNSLGGQDLGFTPGQLLAASLASCTSITLRMYIDRKGWEVDDIEIEVSIEENKETNTTTFYKNISIKGNLDEAQIKRLHAISNACHVHKVLLNPINIETTINI